MSEPHDGRGGWTRRDVVRASSALPALAGLAAGGRALATGTRNEAGGRADVARPTLLPEGAGQGRRVAVVGAGAFGGWTALMLQRAGAEVTLLDAWGPGHSRASSGGESRVIRHAYGAKRIYSEWVVRALQLWRAAEAEWDVPLYRETGVLWLVQDDEQAVLPALPILEDLGVAYERIDPDEIARRWPAVALDGVRWGMYEPGAGYLWARDNCARVVEAFVAAGGEYREAWVEPGRIDSNGLQQLHLAGGATLGADAYVFACGPWLGRAFPDAVGGLVKPTRQEIYYFGLEPGSPLAEGRFPVWADHGERLWYGIPGSGRRGFKIADDTLGPEVDPTTQERVPGAEGIARARAYLGRRFPTLARAPLVESRVCQYEVSPDGDFIIDRHPGAANVWLVGGGSGHGYKHGPALGEHVAGLVTATVEPEPRFALSRFR